MTTAAIDAKRKSQDAVKATAPGPLFSRSMR
jgi:hypothetical protein